MKYLYYIVVACLLIISALPQDVIFAQSNTDIITKTIEPPVETVNRVDKRKLQLAKDLTKWMRSTLQEQEALVAVIARKGGNDVKKHDKTGMAHSGLAVYDPRLKTYIIYNLLSETKASAPISKIWRSAPVNFFYGQTGYHKNALLLIPDKITQDRLYNSILNNQYQNLLFTNKYNLLSSYASNKSLNCNKWLLMMVVAARTDDYQPTSVLQTIKQGYNPIPIRLSTIEKFFVRQKPNVRSNEIPKSGGIYTVTIESLYKSKDLFPVSIFYSDL